MGNPDLLCMPRKCIYVLPFCYGVKVFEYIFNMKFLFQRLQDRNVRLIVAITHIANTTKSTSVFATKAQLEIHMMIALKRN